MVAHHGGEDGLRDGGQALEAADQTRRWVNNSWGRTGLAVARARVRGRALHGEGGMRGGGQTEATDQTRGSQYP